MATVLPGPKLIDGGRDEEGHRSYSAIYKLSCLANEGPVAILNAIDAAVPMGSTWSQFSGNDVDVYAYRTPATKMRIIKPDDGPALFWTAAIKFTTKPPTDRCLTTPIQNPINEPAKLRGGFGVIQREQSTDRFGELIVNSAHESIRGNQVEFDEVVPTISVSQNVLNLELGLIDGQVNTCNDATLWGMGSRKVRLVNFTWERKLYGTCNFFYTRNFEFAIDGRGFDRDLLDEGTKVLKGHWEYGEWVLDDIDNRFGTPVPPNPSNPKHFQRFKDLNGENARVILDGAGKPTDGFFGTSSGSGSETNAGNIHVEYYGESNFLLLGIPTTL